MSQCHQETIVLVYYCCLKSISNLTIYCCLVIGHYPLFHLDLFFSLEILLIWTLLSYQRWVLFLPWDGNLLKETSSGIPIAVEPDKNIHMIQALIRGYTVLRKMYYELLCIIMYSFYVFFL